jgi:lysozyme
MITSSNARGVDLSHRDGSLSMEQLRSEGYSFVGLKATDGKIIKGSMFVDPTYHDRLKEAFAADLTPFSFHYFRPTWNASQQSSHFLLHTPTGLHGQLPPALDLELDDDERERVDPRAYLRSALTFLAHVEDRLRVKPMIYTYRSFWEWLGNPKKLSVYLLWVADYNKKPQPALFGGWNTWACWQTTDQGTAAGASGLDLNVWNGDEESLKHRIIP